MRLLFDAWPVDKNIKMKTKDQKKQKKQKRKERDRGKCVY